MQIAMNELKAGLSRYVARARAGETVVITSHDKPVARLIGMPPAAVSGASRMILSGAAEWAEASRAFQPPVQLVAGGRSVSDIVREERR